uniref:Acetyltransferase n=1 Tax=uncultured Bacillota bacterium TaxID=344338 RepID=A0A650EPA4_9FIRM|nr:acetyltransferase [uncultured Firmicutes bacterium]
MKQIILVGDEIRLEQAAQYHQQGAEEMKREFFNRGEQIINGSALFDQMDFDAWLENCARNSNPATVCPDWAVATTFFAVRKADEKVIGMIDVRHGLTVPFLQEYGGHIGYAVRPSERRKGYATQMLRLALGYCRSLGIESAMLGCYAENEASVRTIERCGGKRTEEKPYTDGKLMFVYQVPCKTEYNA